MNINKNELTIRSGNAVDVLELTDADLVQVQGGWGSNCDHRESHNDEGYWKSNNDCNSWESHHRHHGWSSHHYQDWNSNNDNNSWGSNNSCNHWGSNNGRNSCENR